MHFFKDDETFQGVMRDPRAQVQRLAEFALVLTPDPSLTTAMPDWQRAQRVVWSRQVGVVWETHGITVVPTVRWICERDYAVVTSGIPQNSIIAVASYMSVRDLYLRDVIMRGLPAIVERARPAAVLVYGRVVGSPLTPVFNSLRNETKFVECLPLMAQQRRRRPVPMSANMEPLFSSGEPDSTA